MLSLEIRSNGLWRLERLRQRRKDAVVGGVATDESHPWIPLAQVVVIKGGKTYRLGRVRAAAPSGWEAE
jgi:hypothetical protein